MRWLAGLVLAITGCSERIGDALVICHNANCAEGATMGGDDTLAALRASLALRTPGGRVVFDGMELDSVWDRARGRCSFSHAPDPDARDLAGAVELVADHVAGSPAGAAAHNEDTFYLKIELKTDVGGGAAHTATEVLAHVACVTAAAQAVIAAGVASHNRVTPIFDSDDPALLAAIDPQGFAASPGPGCLFETGWSAALPAGFAPQILTVGWYEDPQLLTWDRAAARMGLDDAGLPNGGGLAIWARSPTPQDLYGMLVQRPAYLVVNNVEDARGLLDHAAP